MNRATLLALPLIFSGPGRAQDADPADPDRARIAAVERVGGSVIRDDKRPGSPVTDIAFISPITDADLELALVFPELDRLSVYNGRITDAGLLRLSTVPRLKILAVSGSAVTDDGWAALVGLPGLEHLSIRRTPISDTGVVHLERLANVRSITLQDTDVTEAGVARLKEALPYALVTSYRDTSLADAEPSAAEAGTVAGVVGLLAVLVWRGVRARRPTVWRVAVVAVLVGLAGTGLWLRKDRMRPVKDGDAGAFWYAVTRLDVGAKQPLSGSFYPARDGWYIYYATGFHGRFLYRVGPAEVEALFPTVVARLGAAPPGRLEPDVAEGFQEWQVGDAEDMDGLLTAIHAARERRLNARVPGRAARAGEDEAAFAERWRRAGRYAWNVGFEFAVLSGVIVFAAWPWLRRSGRVAWAVHLGLTPGLFCLPFWLGYAPLTFTSAGDTEGVLYPRLLVLLRGLPWTGLDTTIVRGLPKPLEPLSQHPGPMLSLSGFGPVGPVAMLALGAAVALAVLAGPWLVRQAGRWPTRGGWG